MTLGGSPWAEGSSLKTEALWMISFIGALAMIIGAAFGRGAWFSAEDIDTHRNRNMKIDRDRPLPRGSAQANFIVHSDSASISVQVYRGT